MTESNKVRTSIAKKITLIPTESNANIQISLVSGEQRLMTAREIFDCMSEDPSSLMTINPSASSLSDEEKSALDQLFDLFKHAAQNSDKIRIQRNCLEVLSAHFGLLHPRRKEAVKTLIWATTVPVLKEFSSDLIKDSIKMLNEAKKGNDAETLKVIRELLELFGGNEKESIKMLNEAREEANPETPKVIRKFLTLFRRNKQ